MSNFPNQIETPQIIIGKGDRLGSQAKSEGLFKKVFLDFENKRAPRIGEDTGAGSTSVAQWYKSAVSLNSIFLSTLENSDVKSFSHKLNSGGSPEGQGMFSVEVLDPTNTFEARFFEYFFEGLEDFVDFIPKAAEEATLTSESIVKTQSKISQLGRTRAVYITFGAGNDARLWAPVQRAYLASIEYSLTKEGVKRLVLNFVSNLGLLNFSASLEETLYFKSDAQTSVTVKENCIQVVNDAIFSSDPIYVIHSLITKLFQGSTTSVPIVMLDDLREDVTKAWSAAIFRATHQRLMTMAKADLKGKGAPEAKNWEEAAKEVADKLIQNVHSGKENLGGEIEFNTPAMINSTVLSQEDLAMFERHGTLVRDIEGLLKPAPWQTRGPGGGSFHWQGEGTAGSHRAAEERFKIISGIVRKDIQENHPDMAGESYSETGDILKDIGGQMVDSQFIGPVPLPNPWSAIVEPIFNVVSDAVTGELEQKQRDRDRRARFDQYSHGQPWLYPELKGVLGLAVHKTITVTGIKIDQIEAYKIFLAANIEFYTKFGFTVAQEQPTAAAGVKTTPSTIPGASQQAPTGDTGTPITKLVKTQLTPVVVSIIAKGPEQVRDKLKFIFSSLGSLTTVNPIFHTFSELKLVKRCQEFGALPPNQETLFVVASWATITSLIDVDVNVRDKRLGVYSKSELTWFIPWGSYLALFEIFEALSEEEPAAAFPKLFQNLGFEETILSKHTITDSQGQKEFINRLEVAGSTKNTFATKEKFQKMLSNKKIPVFNYGFKNSNIIKFDFNLKPWYGLLLNIIPTVAVNGAISRSVRDLGLTKKLLQFLDIGPDKRKNIEDIKEGIGQYWDDNFSPPPSFDFMGGETLIGGQFFGEGAGRSSWDQATSRESPESSLYAIAEKEVGDLRAKAGSGRETFIETYAYFLAEVLKHPDRSQFLVTNPNKTSQEIADLLLTIRDRLASKIFEGRITTLPLYTLMSSSKTIGARALLYFVEPEIMTSHDFKSKGLRSTWLSGEYIIIGYEIKINGNEVTTSFDIAKKTNLTRSQRRGFA